MNADGTSLEVLGQNFRNPYEVAVDSWGNVFQTDNDDDGNAWTRLVYNMEGGNYGFRGPLNKTWSEDHGTHWHQELPGVAPLLYRIGAGSPCGLLVYEGTLLPAKYRGQLMHADAGKRIVAMYPLEERRRRLRRPQRRCPEWRRRHVGAADRRGGRAGRRAVRRRLVRPRCGRPPDGRRRQARPRVSYRAGRQQAAGAGARPDIRRQA